MFCQWLNFKEINGTTLGSRYPDCLKRPDSVSGQGEVTRYPDKTVVSLSGQTDKMSGYRGLQWVSVSGPQSRYREIESGYRDPLDQTLV